MRVLLENVNEKHIRLLKKMATILNFKVNKLENPQTLEDHISVEAEKEMTLFAMQASEQPLTEIWENEDDDYWNSYL